jgi:hypothetical protein
MASGGRCCEERDNAETLRRQRRAEKDGERKTATTEDAENTGTCARLPGRAGTPGKRRRQSYAGHARHASGAEMSFKTHARSYHGLLLYVNISV